MPARGEDARVRCEVDGPVATITLSRPDRRNAQTPVTWAALRTIGSDLPADVRVVVVRGEGASFSAGLDRAMFAPEGLPSVATFVDIAHAPAVEAERIGLVNLVVARDNLDGAVLDLVTALLVPPRDAVVETKALLLGAALRGPAEQLLAERQAQLRRIRDLAGVGESEPAAR
jgi:enoyl-CoA hydratase/carnithine racemase